MRFKIDENLKIVVLHWDHYQYAPMAEFSKGLCAALIDAGMIEDTPDNWGVTVIQATGDKLVSDVCAVLAEYLYGDESHSVPADVFDAFCAITVMGDGDCPHCGGELRFVETEGHELKDGDYYTPNSYVIDNYVYQCRECGETIKSEKEL